MKTILLALTLVIVVGCGDRRNVSGTVLDKKVVTYNGRYGPVNSYRIAIVETNWHVVSQGEYDFCQTNQTVYFER